MHSFQLLNFLWQITKKKFLCLSEANIPNLKLLFDLHKIMILCGVVLSVNWVNLDEKNNYDPSLDMIPSVCIWYSRVCHITDDCLWKMWWCSIITSRIAVCSSLSDISCYSWPGRRLQWIFWKYWHFRILFRNKY